MLIVPFVWSARRRSGAFRELNKTTLNSNRPHAMFVDIFTLIYFIYSFIILKADPSHNQEIRPFGSLGLVPLVFDMPIVAPKI